MNRIPEPLIKNDSNSSPDLRINLNLVNKNYYNNTNLKNINDSFDAKNNGNDSDRNKINHNISKNENNLLSS